MKYKKFGNKFIVKIEKGEEIVETIKRFCKEQKIMLGTVVGIGAANKITLGLFETKTKKYHSKEFSGDYEICQLYGNVSTMKDDVYLHIHVNIADSNHNSFGGHLNSAVCSATFEAVIEKIDGKLDREFSEEIGLNLYKM
jgi:predicted DNA-binding protein with PD1-like motif